MTIALIGAPNVTIQKFVFDGNGAARVRIGLRQINVAVPRDAPGGQ